MMRRLSFVLLLALSLAPAFGQVPPPVPALPDTERRTSYALSASTCSCTVNFVLYGDSTDFSNWIEVWLNGVQIQYNDPVKGWTITSPTGPLATIPRPITDGVLTFANAQTGTVQIVGARRPRRVSQFAENQGVSARNLNQVITDIVAMLREAWDKINDVTGRIIVAPPGEIMTPLPPKSNRAGFGLCFDTNGNPTVCASTGSTTFAAGNGISFTGTGPTVIKNNIQAGAGISLTGTNPIIITATKGTSAVGYAPAAGNDCSAGAAAAPDDTAALTADANHPYPVSLAQNRCYKITSTVVMTTNGGGLVGDRTAQVWMPAASFNSTTLCSTLNCFTSNAVGFYIQGQLSTPFTPIDRAVLSGFQIFSEVADGRAVGPIVIRNASNSNVTNLEMSGFPVAAGIYVDTAFYSHFDGNFIHNFTTNSVWATAPGIQAISVDGSRVNGTGSRWNTYNNNNIQSIIFGSVPAATYTQQPVGIGVYTVNAGLGDSTISGNIINTTGECIDLYASRNTVIGNTLLSCAIAGISIKHGGSYNVVGHNLVYAAGVYGMTLSGGASGPATSENLFDGNSIIELDPAAVGPPVSACFRFNNNGQTFTDSGNVIQNTYCDAAGGKYGFYGDSSDGAGNYLSNNIVTGYSTQAYNLASSTAQQWGGFTVAQLTTLGCTASMKGLRLYATDQSGAPSFLGALTGGGSITTPVICNGTAWEAG